MNSTWKKLDSKIYGRRSMVKAGQYPLPVMFRIDGRSGSYRVDRMGVLDAAWEAIDGGNGFATLAKAKAHVAAWIRAAKTQSTMTPKI